MADVKISARVPRADVAELERRARKADRSLSAELRRAIKRYLADQASIDRARRQ